MEERKWTKKKEGKKKEGKSEEEERAGIKKVDKERKKDKDDCGKGTRRKKNEKWVRR